MAPSKSALMSDGLFLLPQPRVVDLTDTDDYDSIDEDGLALWMAQDAEDEMRRSSLAKSEFKPETSQRPSTIVPRNLPIAPPFVILDTFAYNDIPLTEKVYVELEDGDFLRIIHIVRDTSTLAVTLRGWKFRRTRLMNDLLEKKLNEVCWILHIDDDDPRDAKRQGMETVSVREVVKRRSIRLTNQSFPALSWRRDGSSEKSEIVEKDRVLVCRFKYICVYANAEERALYKWREKGLHRLREDECDQRLDNNVKDEELRNVWRGSTVLGGAQEGWLPGEREFLRQEDVSHRGIASRSSLKVPTGQDFLMGDPMKRGSVGSLLTEYDLQQSSDRATQSTSLGQRHSTITNGPLVSNGEILRSQKQQRQDRRRSHYNFTGFNGLPIDSRGYDTDEDYGIFDWRRGLRQSSIQPRYSGNKSPRIIEIDAQVKTSSSSGTFEKRYEGKITSRYYPTPDRTQKKRPIDMSSGSPVRPIKRVDRGLRAEPGKREFREGSRTLPGNRRYPHEELATSSGDRTLGRSPNAGGYKTSAFGLLTPVSRRKGSKLPRSQNSMLPPGMGDFSECSQQPRLLSRTARSSVVSHTQTNGTTEDDNNIVDLTRPQANSYGSFSGGRPSTLRHSGASHPLYERSVLSQNPYKTSSSRGKSPRHTYANPRFNSESQMMPIEHASKANQRRYTVGDCFCGAGGMSRGAVSAGLRINWGFDCNPVACQTYAMNFFGTPIYNVWADKFSAAAGDHKVDICHMSPPCQFFSNAHTIPGKDDEMNTASLFAILYLLDKAKPRIVTLEQTSGLLRRHAPFFNSVIMMFTSKGFSVRWKIMNCADFGLPQRRMRLFIIASCPGEVLPPFPPPTHSSDPEQTGLKPWTTINEAIAKIPHGWPNHDIHLAKERNNPPQSGDKLAACVTTSGGGIIHPSGKRDYTHREFACLQGFPLGHKFGASGVKKQLGNAVPPAMAKILLETVKNALLKADGLL